MNSPDLICNLISDIIKLLTCLGVFGYGITHFFKRGKPLNLMCITMSFGSFGLAVLFHLCQNIVKTQFLGFSLEYLGYVGFFMFMITATYGYLDRIIDDGSKSMKSSKIISLLAPGLIMVSYVVVLLTLELNTSLKVIYFILWSLCAVSCYFNLKHAIIPNVDFGFVQAIKPFNILAIILQVSSLLCLVASLLNNNVMIIISAVLFSAITILTIIFVKKGVAKWTI